MFLYTAVSVTLIKYQFCFSYIGFEILLHEAAGLAEWMRSTSQAKTSSFAGRDL